MRPHEEIGALEAVKLLQSMGCNVTEQDLEYSIACNTGPLWRESPGKKWFRWYDILQWAGRTFPIPELTRKQATEFLRSIGCQISDTTLQQMPRCKERLVKGEIEYVITAKRGPPYVRRARETYYKEEHLREWAEKRKEAKSRPPEFYAPKSYKPRYAVKRCPWNYKFCGKVKFKDCDRYARALSNFAHLPSRRVFGEWSTPTVTETEWTKDCAKLVSLLKYFGEWWDDEPWVKEEWWINRKRTANGI
jgi:hypothetical protein